MFSHRDETATWMREAIEQRRTTTLADVLAKPRSATSFDRVDLERGRVLAEKQGVAYLSYVRRLLHEAIEREERKLAS